MTREPCKECPFRIESKMGYDDDAMEALGEGLEPACHAVVGVDHVFAAMHRPSERCTGFDRWEDGVDGYVLPRPSI